MYLDLDSNKNLFRGNERIVDKDVQELLKDLSKRIEQMSNKKISHSNISDNVIKEPIKVECNTYSEKTVFNNIENNFDTGKDITKSGISDIIKNIAKGVINMAIDRFRKIEPEYTVCIDNFYEEWAVCTKRPDFSDIDIPISKLPESVNVGTILDIYKDGSIKINNEETQKLRDDMVKLRERVKFEKYL